MRINLLPLLLLPVGPLLAESALQTDWSGGPGVYGPVATWGDTFFIADAMDWDTEPGQLKLIVNRSENVAAAVVSLPPFLVVMDMDQDGNNDIAYSSYGSGTVMWARNQNGQGTTWSQHLVGNVPQPQFIAAGDFDGDGLRDIAASSATQNSVVWFRNNSGGSSWSAPTTIAQNFDAQQIRVGDVDGDGAIDVVGVSWDSGDVVWWRNGGSGNNWTINYIDGSLMGAYACHTGDLNGDIHPDVVAVSYSTGRIVAYISQSPWGYNWTHQEVGTFPGVRVVVLADVNDDGKNDIVAGSSAGGGSLRWYNHVSGSTWNTNLIDGSAPGLSSISAVDMDGDGSPDVLASSTSGNCVYWFKNFLKLSQPWERYTIVEGFAGAYCVASGDMNGDGVPDAASCGLYAGRVSWWRVSGFNSPAVLTSSILDVDPVNPGALTWDYVHFSQVTPPQTMIQFRMRTSYNSSDMGPWSGWFASPGSLGSVVTQGGRYVQYQTRLSTGNPNVTPSLKDVTILYNMYGIEEGSVEATGGMLIRLPQGNPAHGAFTVSWTVQTGGPVSVSVYDTAGRSVAVLQQGEIEPGDYSALVGSLPAGVYAVVMTGPDGIAARRVTVLND